MFLVKLQASINLENFHENQLNKKTSFHNFAYVWWPMFHFGYNRQQLSDKCNTFDLFRM